MPNIDDKELVPSWMLVDAMVALEHLVKALDDYDVTIETTCCRQLCEWWLERQEKDKDRIRQEAAMKLTESERNALGIDDKGQNLRKSRVIK